MKKLIQEIHRRSMWQVLSIYVVGSWVALQVVDVLANNYGLPSWFPAFALALLVIGLPIVLATAFVQEGVGAREEQEPQADAGPVPQPASRSLFTWRKALGGGVAALALWGAVTAGWMLFGPGAARQGDETATVSIQGLRSVAVLPFITRAREGDEDAVMFSEGMHDDVLTQLSKIESLKVISRTTMVRYADSELSIPQIADELGVATVLEGGIQRSGTRVRVNVQLIKAATDEHLWAETYDQELTAANIFSIQSDLARKIAGALRATLTPETEARIVARPTESLEAFDLYTRARYILVSPLGNSRDGLVEARESLERAIAADSAYAQAWSLLSTTHFRLWYRAHVPAEEALPAAWAAVDHALALDPDLAVAHARRGRLLMAELRYDEAEAEFVRALELNPGSAEVRGGYSNLLADRDRFHEAVQEARRAVEVDPLSADARIRLGNRLAWARDWSGVVAESRKVIEMEPDDSRGHYHLGLGHAMLGEHADAIAAYTRARVLDPSDAYLTAALAWAYAHAGIRDSALAVLEEVPEQGAMLKEIAIVYGVLGDLDTAYEYLDRVADEDPGMVGELRTDPTADALRADPRWQQLLGKVGLE